MVGLHQILAGNVITCLKIVNAVSSFERLGLRLTVTEINIKKVQKQDLKNIKNVKKM